MDGIRETVMGMDTETFVRFAQELQLAYRTHHHRFMALERYILGNDGPHAQAYDLSVQNKKRSNSIAGSSIYDAVRHKMRSLGCKVPEHYCGWIGFEDQGIVDEINHAIDVIAIDKHPPSMAEAAFRASEEKVGEARSILDNYGWEGVFIDRDDLTEAFLEKYGESEPNNKN